MFDKFISCIIIQKIGGLIKVSFTKENIVWMSVKYKRIYVFLIN